MKIGSIRVLLILVDLALAGSIGWIVTIALKEKTRRRDDTVAWEKVLTTDLQKHRPAAAAGKTLAYGQNVAAVALHGKDEKPVETKVDTPAPLPSVRPELSSLLKIAAIQRGPGEPKSLVYIIRQGPGAPADPAAALKEVSLFEEGQAVEWAPDAVVSRILPDKVIFRYDGKEVTIEYPPLPKDAAASAAPGGAAGGRGPAAVPNTDPKTWIVYQEGKTTIEVTDVGVASMVQQGDASLADVRWSTEKLPDGRNGVRIDHIPEGSVLKQGGAKEGDVLHSINGERMSTKSEVMDYVRSHQNMTRFEVKFYRNGILHMRIVNVPRR